MSKVIPKNVLEDIRSANDIVEVVGAYLQLKRGGSAHKALCPFHKEKTPSFNVNPADGRFTTASAVARAATCSSS